MLSCPGSSPVGPVPIVVVPVGLGVEGVEVDRLVRGDPLVVGVGDHGEVVDPGGRRRRVSGVSGRAFGWACRVMLCGNAFP